MHLDIDKLAKGENISFRLLIVEDLPTTAFGISERMKAFGHQIIDGFPNTASQCVNVVEKKFLEIDIVIADVQLKDEDEKEGGMKAASLLNRGEFPPFVMISATKSLELQARCLKIRNVFGFVNKENPNFYEDLNFALYHAYALYTKDRMNHSESRAKSFLQSYISQQTGRYPSEEQINQVITYYTNDRGIRKSQTINEVLSMQKTLKEFEAIFADVKKGIRKKRH